MCIEYVQHDLWCDSTKCVKTKKKWQLNSVFFLPLRHTKHVCNDTFLIFCNESDRWWSHERVHHYEKLMFDIFKDHSRHCHHLRRRHHVSFGYVSNSICSLYGNFNCAKIKIILNATIARRDFGEKSKGKKSWFAWCTCLNTFKTFQDKHTHTVLHCFDTLHLTYKTDEGNKN